MIQSLVVERGRRGRTTIKLKILKHTEKHSPATAGDRSLLEKTRGLHSFNERTRGTVIEGGGVGGIREMEVLGPLIA